MKPAMILAVATTLTALSGTGCGARAHPNLLLVIVDTLRADRLTLYGHSRPTSPAIDALAREGVRFDHAYVAAPWTQPSIASLLTGQYPRRHGLVRMRQRLPEDALTLAEILRAEGWSTAAVVSNLLLGRVFGFRQGFERYSEEEARGHDYVSSVAVTRRAIDMLGELERPFFLMVHYFDPHYAYMPHASVDFAAVSAGRLSGGERIEDLRQMDLDSEEQGFLRDVYDEELRFTDDAIADLLAAAADRKLFANTLIVVTADHGEEFLDRGWIGHTRTLYDELIRVPLVIRLPDDPSYRSLDARGVTVMEAVSLVALPPTLLELMGADVPPGAEFEHRSLVPIMKGDADGVEPVFAEVDFVPSLEAAAPATPKSARMRAIVVGSHKLIHDELAGRFELYDIERDPGERVDLAPRDDALVRELRAQLDADLGPPGPASEYAPMVEFPAAFKKELAERLRSLGYVHGDLETP